MKKYNHIITLFFLCMSIIVYGQNNSKPKTEEPYIDVVGAWEIEVVPDEINVGIVINERFWNRTKITVEEQEEKLLEIIRKLGVEMDRLTLANANSEFVKVRIGKRENKARKEFNLKLSDAETVSRLFQELDDIEITNVYLTTVSHSKLDSLRKEVRIAAIKDAKYKADYLLEAIGEETGKPLVVEVRERDTPNNEISIRGSREGANYYYIDGIKVRGTSLKEESEQDIEFKKIKVRADVYVRFSIK